MLTRRQQIVLVRPVKTQQQAAAAIEQKFNDKVEERKKKAIDVKKPQPEKKERRAVSKAVRTATVKRKAQPKGATAASSTSNEQKSDETVVVPMQINSNVDPNAPVAATATDADTDMKDAETKDNPPTIKINDDISAYRIGPDFAEAKTSFDVEAYCSRAIKKWQDNGWTRLDDAKQFLEEHKAAWAAMCQRGDTRMIVPEAVRAHHVYDMEQMKFKLTHSPDAMLNHIMTLMLGPATESLTATEFVKSVKDTIAFKTKQLREHPKGKIAIIVMDGSAHAGLSLGSMHISTGMTITPDETTGTKDDAIRLVQEAQIASMGSLMEDGILNVYVCMPSGRGRLLGKAVFCDC